MPVVFLDESGFTGGNLCDDAQPVFVLASHCIPEEECKDLKARFFSGIRSDELKFSSISRRPRQIGMLIDLFDHLTTRQHDIELAYDHQEVERIDYEGDDLIRPWSTAEYSLNQDAKPLLADIIKEFQERLGIKDEAKS